MNKNIYKKNRKEPKKTLIDDEFGPAAQNSRLKIVISKFIKKSVMSCERHRVLLVGNHGFNLKFNETIKSEFVCIFSSLVYVLVS